jgi:phage replication-related protein YjqB (UPF0714/DUF867 family)
MFRRNEIKTAYAAKFTLNKGKFSSPHSREHCSVNADQIRMMGLNTHQQVRIERPTESGTTLALYTIERTHNEQANDVFLDYVDPGDVEPRFRLPTSEPFQGKINPQVAAVGLNDAEAEDYSEFIEHLADNDYNSKLVVIAPHGGNIEQHTDEQAEEVAKQLPSNCVSVWMCKGFKKGGGAFARWHITSTDISEESFPKLKSVYGRGFEYAVAFHGFGGNDDKPSICIGGRTVDATLKQKIKEEIEGKVRRFGVRVFMDNGCPEDINGDKEKNIVNRLSKNGLQIEQSEKFRTTMVDEENRPLRLKVADAVVRVIGPRITQYETDSVDR